LGIRLGVMMVGEIATFRDGETEVDTHFVTICFSDIT
jgi:hypothetical protein